jgi:S-formylglutathione hydrolase FrmB
MKRFGLRIAALGIAAGVAMGMLPMVKPASAGTVLEQSFASPTQDGKFDEATWQSLSWRPLFASYRAQPLVVPLYINSGDIDRFEIPFHAAVLFREVQKHQPGKTAFRVIPGDHEWPVWAGSIGDALKYVSPYATAPVQADPDTCKAAK